MLDSNCGLLPRTDRRAAEPLPDIDDRAFGALLRSLWRRARILLGEANDGTSEFYRARAAISRQLIQPPRLQHRRG